MEGLQLLASADSEIEAELVKGKLAEEGIECFVQFSDSIGIAGVRDAFKWFKGIDIYVEPYDFEKASLLISDLTDEIDDDIDVGPATKG